MQPNQTESKTVQQTEGGGTVASSALLCVARELLKLQRQQDKWHDEIEASGHIEINCPIAGNWLLLHLALDILGEPKDNTIETNACEIANETGEWPEGSHCRDVIVDVYLLMVGKRNDIEGYIEVVTGKRKLPPDGWSNDEQLEAYLYA